MFLDKLTERLVALKGAPLGNHNRKVFSGANAWKDLQAHKDKLDGKPPKKTAQIYDFATRTLRKSFKEMLKGD